MFLSLCIVSGFSDGDDLLSDSDPQSFTEYILGESAELAEVAEVAEQLDAHVRAQYFIIKIAERKN